MSKFKTRLKVKMKDGKVNVKAIMSHPMETGRRKDKKTGEKIPEHYINEVIVTANDKMVLTSEWRSGVSKNPYLSVNYAGKSGDKVKISWKDNKGNTGEAEKTVK
ncbi:MAG: thiosulfate oxidation carrier complex protein SoxZ [Aquificaceae bacterium]|nr:MAG: thiosulfate oxidation carrier complex protein SoxZ [Aquificaceae bacterium]